jgi:predicted membrane metal-binding protein
MNRPALLTAIALALGIVAADWLRPHPALVLIAVVALAAWAGFSQQRVALALLLTVAALGALRYSYAQTAGRGDLGVWEGRTVTLTGTVTGEPELRKPRGSEYTVTVEQVDGRPAMGQLFVTQWSDRAPAYGDRVELRGTVLPPLGPRTPGGFDQAAYLARQGVYFTLEAKAVTVKGPGNLNPLRRVAVAARNRLEQSLRRSLPPRDAVLGIAGAHLHDYGKSPRPGRKVGHCTLVDDDRARLMERLTALREVVARSNQ